MRGRRLLIIDDERGVRSSLALLLSDEGYVVDTAAHADEALERCEAERYDVILCDVRMPRRDGLDLLPDLRASASSATIVMMSAFGDVEQALLAVQGGADDYLAKPFQVEELLLAVRKVEERERLQSENRQLRNALASSDGPPQLVAASDAMAEVLELVECAAEYASTVLVTGESGTGKEVVARSIHTASARADRPFLAVNCGAIPESLIESELFGHARGAFTGADSPRAGLFREADGGTLFLDEVGELPAGMQVKLLRVLQEHEVRPVGEPRAVAVDVRIVAATARDLAREIAAGRFRDDLYYRLNVLHIQVPPLRERRAEIPLLAEQLLASLSRRLGKRAEALSPDLLELLCAHDWPGNVRELENSLERALILAPGRALTRDLFPFSRTLKLEEPQDPATEEGGGPLAVLREPDLAALSIKRRTRALEQDLIRRALEHTGGNRTQAARILEISPRALQYKLKEYDIR